MNVPGIHFLPFRRLLGSAALCSLMALAACGGGSDPPTVPPRPGPAPPPDLNLPDDPDAVILEVWMHRGPIIQVEYSIGRPPRYWLTAGGGLTVEGPEPEIWPPPLLPNLLATTLDGADFAAALEDIAASTLPNVEDLTILEPTGFLADAPYTEFRFRDTAGVHVISVEGLFAVQHRDPRALALKALAEKFETATETAGAYRGDRVQVIVGFDVPLPQPEDRDDREWPLPEPPARTDDGTYPCHVFEGPTAAGLLELFGSARMTTRWVWEDERIFLSARELFPGEEGCRE